MPAVDEIPRIVPRQNIVVVAPENLILAVAATDNVVSSQPINNVVTVQTHDDVSEWRARENFSLVRTYNSGGETLAGGIRFLRLRVERSSRSEKERPKTEHSRQVRSGTGFWGRTG